MTSSLYLCVSLSLSLSLSCLFLSRGSKINSLLEKHLPCFKPPVAIWKRFSHDEGTSWILIPGILGSLVYTPTLYRYYRFGNFTCDWISRSDLLWRFVTLLIWFVFRNGAPSQVFNLLSRVTSWQTRGWSVFRFKFPFSLKRLYSRFMPWRCKNEDKLFSF